MRNISKICKFFKQPAIYYGFSLLLLLSSCQGSSSEGQLEKPLIKVEEEEKPKAHETLLSAKDVVERLSTYAQENTENQMVIHTDLGDIVIRLYEKTPLHRANFVRLAKRGFYDETMFHRVVPGFVMQGGGTDIRKKVKVGKYRVPAEITPDQYIHQRGAVAMARYDEDNPNKESDSHEFYIVWGEDFNRQTLQATAKKYGLTLSAMQKETYLAKGGSPHLDGLYTVFGQVVEGMEVVDKICHLEVDKRGWPLTNVSIKMEVMKGSDIGMKHLNF